MTQKHTPGPWDYEWIVLGSPRIRVTPDEQDGVVRVTAKGRAVTVARVFRIQDAGLIAAAPELLEAARANLAILRQLAEAGHPVHIEMRATESAIAKAEGV